MISNKIYLYDKDNSIQYEINPEEETIIQLSSQGIRYYDGEWTTMTIAEANDEKKFITETVDYTDEQYVRIDKIGDEVGYYYLYKKNGDSYDVYRMSSQDHLGLIYLFSTEDINYIRYVDDHVYFIEGNQIKVYNDRIGLRRLVGDDELDVNRSFTFGVLATQW